MARMRTRPARALLLFFALLSLSVGLAACAMTATTTRTPAETPTRPAPTFTSMVVQTPTQALAPTPTHVPAGWTVFATPQFSLAYPAGFSVNTISPSADYPFTLYYLVGATKGAAPVRLSVQPQAQAIYLAAYCASESDDQTFANLLMHYDLEGEGQTMRTWDFANSDGTVYILQAGDANEDATTQAADTAILATFRSADTTPWRC